MSPKNKKIRFFTTLLILLAFAYSTHAYVSSSTNYRIQSDSINVGGTRQTSSNYISEDTIGEIATGLSNSALYKLKAGYQQMNEVYISISAADDVNMTPDIPGVTGGTGNGNTSWTVLTDSPAGYSLTMKASTSPALQSGSYYFSDYTPTVGGTPDYDWGIDTTTSEFGFTPEGNDIVQKFQDNGADTCNTGSSDTTDKCWYNLSTSSEDISGSTSSNHPSGTVTTIKLRAESGTSNVQEEGTYTAKISGTAVAL